MGRLFCGGGDVLLKSKAAGRGRAKRARRGRSWWGRARRRVVQGEGRPQGAPAKPGPAASGRRNRPKDGLPCGRGPGRRRRREGRAGGPQARRRSRRHGRSPCVSTQSKRPAAACPPPAQKAAHRLPLSRARAPQMCFQITFCFSHFPLKYRGR